MLGKIIFKNKFILIILVFAIAGIALTFGFLRPRKKEKPQKPFKGVAYFSFNLKDALKGWEKKEFKGRVSYSIRSDTKGYYLDAYSDKAASGIIRWIRFNPRKHPMVAWQWKAVKFPLYRPGIYEENWWIEKEDYVARFYVIFPRTFSFQFYCLEYVWDETLPKGSLMSNPNFKNLKVIILESGRENLGKWVREERNIYADFKLYFGKEPGNVGAIALMTDADNSASIAEAQYKNIEVGYEE